MGCSGVEYNNENKNTKNIRNKEKNERYEIWNNNYITVDLINKTAKSICKITYPNNEGFANGTGFFMEIKNKYDSFRYLITCFHVVPKNLKDKNINLEIDYPKNIQLAFNLKNRHIRFFEDPLIDITAIQIKDEDSNIIKMSIF